MAERPRQKSLFDREERTNQPPEPVAAEPRAIGEGLPNPPRREETTPQGEVLSTQTSSFISHPSSTPAGKTVWVIDANSLIHQVFHALPEMSSPRGEPVGAVFGFARDLFYLLENKQPDYLFCAFDVPGKTFRHELYEQYKADRPEMHADLAPQFVSIRRVIDAMGIPALECEAFEADDILATVARLSEESGAMCYLVTGDKDCRQLITDRVKVYNIRKDQTLDREVLKAEWGIAPEQVVDYQTLVGDPTDNVPGVPLIGPKSAQQLLAKYGTLEGVFEHAHEISGTKKRDNLLAGKEKALVSRKLVRLKSDVPCAVDWSAGRVGRIDRNRLRGLFMEFGFRSLARKAEEFAVGSAQKEEGESGRGGEGGGCRSGPGTEYSVLSTRN
jgi:DNA polymerase-1